MKTTISFVIAAIFCTTTMAQPNQRWNNNDRKKDQKRNVVYKNNISHMSDRDVRIYRVNRKYDSKYTR